MTVRVYRSTDASAPQLVNGAAGSIIAILDACLVNGYGSKTAAGWTKPFTGTNIACFRQGVGSNSRYLQVTDSNADYALMLAFEDMTAYNVGTAQFPSALQLPTAVMRHYRWDGTTNAAGRGWLVVADEKFFHLFTETSVATPGNYGSLTSFGDLIGYKGSDNYDTYICGSNGNGHSAPNYDGIEASLSTNGNSRFLARRFDQIGGSQNCGMHTDGSLCPGFGNSANLLSYPHAVDGSLWMSRCYVHEAVGPTYVVRGEIPGIWIPCHDRPFNHNDQFVGTGELSGKSFQGFRCANGSNSFALEVSDTWYG